MADKNAIFEEMKSFFSFTEEDEKNLVSLAPVFAKHGPAITDRFYETLAEFPETAKFIEGQVDRLKTTHARWMGELFAGDYGADYLDSRWTVGMVHVRIGLSPYWVEAVMNVIRTDGLAAITAEIEDPAEIAAKYRSLLKILDLDLLIINLAYSEERLDRMSAITGMSRKLVENLVKRGGKKKRPA